MGIKIGIIGSRRRDTKADLAIVTNALYDIFMKGDVIVSGGCKKGGDKFAEIIAEELGAQIIIYLPDRSKLDPDKMKKNPKWAFAEINYARNTLVAKNSHCLIACVAPDRKGGTEDTIKKFLKFVGCTEEEAIKIKILYLV